MSKSLRPYLLQFALIAFLFSAIAPFFALYEGQIANTEPSRLEALYGDEIFICTENGFQWVKVADVGKGQHNPSPAKHFECAMCYVSTHGAKAGQLAPLVLSLARDAGQELRVHFSAVVHGGVGIQRRPSNPRAPPFVV
jgi:hypothetical protein